MRRGSHPSVRSWLPLLTAGIVLTVPSLARGEGSYQVGLSQRLFEYNGTNTLILPINRPIYVDILTAGEVINVSFCGQFSFDDLRVRIFNPSSAPVLDQTLTDANCNCFDAFNTPLTNPIRYTTLVTGRYEVQLFNDSRTDGRLNRFDITVTPNTSTNPNPTVAGGRVHAQDWAFDAVNYSETQSTDADYFILVPVNGAQDTTYVWQLDLNNLAGYIYEILGNPVGLNPPSSGLSGPQAGNSVAVNYQIYLGYPALAGAVPTAPPQLGNFRFVDDQGIDATISPAVSIGIQDQGVFLFNANTAGTYAITIDETGDGIFGAGDVLLLGPMVQGLNTVSWNGRRNDGTVLPVGDYEVQLAGRIGEYHFIGGDVETSGGPVEQGLTIRQATSSTTFSDVLVYWDDFTLLGGTFTVPNGALSSTVQGHHTWGDFTADGFGNERYIDTYVYGLTSFTESVVGIVDDDAPVDPVIGLAKSMTVAGLDTVTIDLKVKNLGTVDLDSVRIGENLNTAFGPGNFGLAGTPSVIVGPGTIVLDPAFTGAGADTQLLTVASTLAQGDSAVIRLRVVLASGGTYSNRASAFGASLYGNTWDLSDAGVNPDPNGNGDPTEPGENDPATVTLEAPAIEVSKSLIVGPVNNGDGTYWVGYRLNIDNLGDVSLSALQLSDNLAISFAGAGFVVDSVLVINGGLTANPGFTGSAPDTNLLSGTNVLAVGASGVVDLYVTVTPGGNLGPYGNSAHIRGTSPGSNVITDGSDVVPVSFVETPAIDVTKAVVGSPVNRGDGTYAVTYALTVANTGDVPLTGVQLGDNLAATFAGAAGFAVDSVRVVSGSLTVDPGFTGSAPDTNVLSGTDALSVGASGAVRVHVRVTPGANLGPYGNTASGEGTSPGLSTVVDGSGAATVSFSESPEITVSKAMVGSPVNRGDGTYGVTYALTVANTGDVPLSAVQMSDDLAVTFAGATGFGVDSARVASGSLTLDPGFTGSAPDTNVLSGTDSLGVGASGVLHLFVTVTPGANLGPYGNVASGDGTSPGLTTVTDASGPVPVSFSESPEIMVSKAMVGSPVNRGDGTYGVTYALTVANTGDVPLSAVQMSDDLAVTFAGATGFGVDSARVASGSLTLDPGFTGSAPDTNVLSGTDSLGVGASGVVHLFVTVTPGANLGPYGNVASGEGTSPGLTPVTDGSGSVPVSFVESPEITVSKAVASTVNRGDGTYGLTYSLTLVNTGDVPLSGVRLSDDLAATFASAAGFVMDSVRVVSGSLTAEPGFTGSAPDTNVLAGTDVLGVGASGVVHLHVTVTPGGNLGPYGNAARAEGTSPGATTVEDGSGAVLVTFGEAPEVTVAKTVLGSPVNRGDGTYGVVYELTVANTGDVALSGVLLSDDLATTFAGAAGFVIDSVLVVSGSLSLDPAFTGSAPDTNLLAGTDVLAVGAGGVVNVYVTLTPGANLGPYGNAASAEGTSTGLTVVTGGSGPVPVTFGESPEITVSKTVLGTPDNRGDGTYGVTYALTVTNTGDIPLSGIRLTDDLAATFAGATGFGVDSVRVVSGSLSLDPAFTGSAPDTSLLAGSDVLGVGASGIVNLYVTVTPGADTGPYGNAATGEGTSPGLATVTDGSGSVAVTFNEAPEITVSKAMLGPPVNRGDGTYGVLYELTAANTGDVPLTGLQLSDDLGTTFAGALSFVVDSVRVVSGTLTLDPGYTGSAPDTNVLAGTDILGAGASGVATVFVTVTPGANLGTYRNLASGVGTSPALAIVGDGSTLVPVTFGELPQLGIAKSLMGLPVNHGDGTYTATYRLIVENSGDVSLQGVQLSDDLAAAFAGAVSFTLDSVVVVSGPLTLDPAYTGSAPDTNLLAGTDVLGAGLSAALDLVVTVTPGGNLGPYGNRAYGEGTSPAGASVTDASVEGLVPDRNGNGDPGDDDGDTPVTFGEMPLIGAAKGVVGGPVNRGDGTYGVAFRITAGNYGNVTLTAVQLSDDLGVTFAGATAFVVDSVRVVSGAVALDAGYTGSVPDTNLLAGTDTLGVGGSVAVELFVTVTPGSDLGPYGNVGRAEGRSLSGATVSDASVNGLDPDGNGNGNPTDDGGSTPVSFVETAAIQVTKSQVGTPVNRGNGTYGVTYELTVQNVGDVLLSGLQLSDDLATTFAGASGFSLDSVRVVSGSLTLDPVFMGTSPDTNLLVGNDVLAVGASGVVSLYVTVLPGGNLGPYDNAAGALGTSPAAVTTTDRSNAVAVSFGESPAVEVIKSVLGPPVNHGDGTYGLIYVLTVGNPGDVPLSGLQVSDDLAAAFAGAAFVVDSVRVVSGSLLLDAGYTGNAPDTTLLAGSDTLGAGAGAMMWLFLTVTPGSNLGPYVNAAGALGTSPAAAIVVDRSSGVAVTFGASPGLQVSKVLAGVPVNQGNGTYVVTYELTAENTGDVALSAVQLSDDLAATFSGASAFVVDSVRVVSGALTLDPAYSGSAPDTNLLAGADVLPVGASGVVDLYVTVTPGGNLGPYDNLALGTGTPPSGTPVGGGSGSVPVGFGEMPLIGAAKGVVGGPVNRGDGTYGVAFRITAGNYGNVTLTAVQLSDDLGATFAGATAFVVDSVRVVSGSVALDAGYTGSAPDTNLLAGTDTLGVGGSVAVELFVTVTPGSDLGPYGNVGRAEGRSLSGATVSDASVNGLDPDGNGNGNPTDDGGSTPVSFVETAAIQVTKSQVGTPVNRGNGTYGVTYELTVQNVGDVLLSGLQLSDDLATTFAGASGFSLDSVRVVSGSLTLDPVFMGTSPDTNLLVGNDVLAVGASGVVSLYVTVLPGGNLGPYDNAAGALGTSPAAVTTTDRSNAVAVSFGESPEIGLAKAVLGSPVNQGGGVYRVTYRLTVENSGDVPLGDVQVSDDLAATFAGASFVVDSVRVASGVLTVNAGFTGSAPDTNLLQGLDVLLAGAAAALDLHVTVTTPSAGTYSNQAWSSGLSLGGMTVTDASVEGLDPDRNGNGDPGDDTGDTPVTLSEAPEIGLAKAAFPPVNRGDGSYRVTFRLTAENSGDVDLAAVQVSDDLSRTFALASSFVVDSVRVVSGGVALDAGYTGSAPDTNLLAGAAVLATGATAVIDLHVTVTPGSNLGPFTNLATAAGTSPLSARVTDLSTQGLDPDPNGNGDPGDDTGGTPVTFAENAELGMAKALSQPVTDNGDGTYTVMFDMLLLNSGESVLNPVQIVDDLSLTFPGAASLNVLDVRVATSGGVGIARHVAYNGVSVTSLLAPGGSLPPAASVSVELDVRVNPGPGSGPYFNVATGTGQSPAGLIVSDQSTEGLIPDADGDGNPGNDGTPTEITLPNQVVSILLDKESDSGEAVVGDLVGYRLRATNTLISPALDVVLIDEFPAGFGYVAGSARLARAGTDGVVGTEDDVVTNLTPTNGATLTFPGIDLAGGEAILVSYLLRVGAGVIPGEYVNRARPTAGGDPAGNTAQAGVTVTDDPIFQRTTLIGTVFLDRDEDGTRDDDEPGLPGVRVVSAEGLLIETDAHGRYHVADVDGGRWERGRNVILKVDPSTLPEGASFTTENPRTLHITPALMSKIDFGVALTGGTWPVEAPGGATLWATQDPGALDPRLDVGGPGVAAIGGVVTFHTYCNYTSYLSGWEIVIYRPQDGPQNPLEVIQGDRLDREIVWDLEVPDGAPLREGEGLRYLLRVRGAHGEIDETHPRDLVLSRSETLSASDLADLETLEGVEGGEVYGNSHLARQTIPVGGGRVRIRGEGLTPRAPLQIDGESVPVDARGAFVLERMLPAGEHDLTLEVTEPDGTTWQRVLHVTVAESAFFMVGIADVTVGQNAVSGDVAPLSPDDRFDEDVFVDGRLAFHLKGKIQGKYLLTAHLDTQEEGIEDLAGDIHKKDARGLLRRLDPDRFYPVYGDGSTTVDDASSQGKLYARLEWSRSRVLWGNYHTGLTGTEFAEYNRSLYGAQAELLTEGSNRYGDSRAELRAFLSEAQSLLGHNEFLATGGSLYYLHDADIVQGSEKVWAEVRDRDSERVVERVTLERGRDYELDDIQGRIILNRPLTTVVEDAVPSIVRDTPLDGNDVFLLVDYEFVPDGFRAGDATYGARAKASPVDAVTIGGTAVNETRGGEDYRLLGVDAVLRGGEGTYLKTEYAESEATQTFEGHASEDGGLTFAGRDSIASDRAGRALGVEGRLDLGDFTDYAGRAQAGAWWKTRDAGFSTARLDRGTEITEYGFETLWRPGSALSLSARGVRVDREGSGKDLSLGAQAGSRFGAVDLTAEVRHTDHVPETGEGGHGTLGATQIGYTSGWGARVYGVGQLTLDRGGDYAKNDLVTVGASAPVVKPLRLRAEGSTGDRGHAVLVGAGITAGSRVFLDLENVNGDLDPHSRLSTRVRLSDNHELYGTYTLSPDRTEGSRNAVTVGQRKTLANQLRIFTESQFHSRPQEAGVGHVFGLDYEPSPAWTFHGSLQSSDLDRAGDGVERDAVSVSVVHQDVPSTASSKVEYRRDRGFTPRTQWLTANRFDRRFGDDFTLLGKLNLSHTEDQTNGRADARFVETGMGLAFRPARSGRLDLLAKYTFVYDLPSRTLEPTRRDERLHVGSIEGLYDIVPKVGVGGKVAGRWAGLRLDSDADAWFDSRTWLAVGRVRYHVVRNWDALVEYRWLRVAEMEDQRHGALLALYRSLSPNLQGGVGFNFTSYSEDLTRTDYNQRGVFLNLVGRY